MDEREHAAWRHDLKTLADTRDQLAAALVRVEQTERELAAGQQRLTMLFEGHAEMEGQRDAALARAERLEKAARLTLGRLCNPLLDTSLFADCKAALVDALAETEDKPPGNTEIDRIKARAERLEGLARKVLEGTNCVCQFRDFSDVECWNCDARAALAETGGRVDRAAGADVMTPDGKLTLPARDTIDCPRCGPGSPARAIEWETRATSRGLTKRVTKVLCRMCGVAINTKAPG